MAEGVNVGHISARLDAVFQDAGFDQFDRRYDKTQVTAAKPVTAKLGADFDSSALDEYDRALMRAKETAGRREQFKAKLGADYNATAFRQFEKALQASRAAAAKPVKAKLEGEFDSRGVDAYNQALDKAQARARRRDQLKARLGADFDEDAFRAFEREVDRAERDVLSLDGTMRAAAGGGGGANALGLRIGGLSGRLGHIIRLMTVASPVIYAAVGGLTALAGSAGAAALGLGALGVAGAAALGPLAALAGAVASRVGVMSEAYDALGKVQTKSAADGQAAAESQAAAADRVKSAEQGLADARRDVQRAQEDLTEAIRAGRRELDDLRLSAERAAIAEQRAGIALQEALERVAEVQADPESTRTELRSAQHAVKEARQALQDARVEKRRADEDARHGTDTVTDAQERLTDARRASARAADDVAKATAAATVAAGEESAAATDAQQKLGELSATERALVRRLKQTSDTLRGVFRPATDAIFGSVDDALVRLTPRVKGFQDEFTDLGKAIADAIDSGSGSLAGERGAQLERILARSDELATLLADSLGSVGEITLNIAEAALPELERSLEDLADWLDEIANASDDQDAMRDRIRELARATRLWVDLLKDTGDLLATVLAGGESDGNKLVRSLDRVIERWDAFLESDEGQRKMRRFFGDARELLGDIWDFLKGAASGAKDTVKQLEPIAKFVGRIVADILGLDDGADGIERVGKVFGAMAILKLAGITRLVGMLLSLGRGAAGIRGALSAAGALGGAGGAGKGGSILDLFRGRGDSPAKPLFVMDVSGGGGPGRGPRGGPAPVPTGSPSRVGNVARGVAGTAARALPPAAALYALIGTQDLDLDELTAQLDALATPNARGDGRGKQLRDLAGALREAVKEGDPKKLRDLAGDIQRIGNESDDLTGKKLRELAVDVRNLAEARDWRELPRVVRGVAKTFRDLDKDANLKDVRKAVETNGRAIRKRLGTDSAAGKEAMAENFRQATRAVQRQMHRGEIATRDGMKAIRAYVEEELQIYGLSLRQARNITHVRKDGSVTYGDPDRNRGREGGAFHQRGGQGRIRRFFAGGWLGARGQVGDDSIEFAPGMYGAPGEAGLAGPGGEFAINNRHQIPYVEQAMAVTKALGLGPFGNLDELYTGVSRPHMFARGGRGGIVPIPGEPGESIHSSILRDVLALKRRFKLDITDGYAASGHAAGGEHPLGLAIDAIPGAGGSWNLIDQLNAWARRQLGKVFRWIGYDGVAGHGRGHHIHLSWLRGANLAGGLGAKVPGRKVSGGGAVGALAQRVLDIARASGQHVLDNSYAPIDTTHPTGGRTATQRTIANTWRQVNPGVGDPHLMSAIAMAESSGDEAAHGPPDGRGWYQIEWPVWGKLLGKYGNPYRGRPNTRMARDVLQQQGLGAWVVHNTGAFRRFMQRGGRGIRRAFRAGGRGVSRFFQGGGHGFTPGGSLRAGVNRWTGGGGGTKLQIRGLTTRQSDRIGDFERLQKQLARDRRRYEQKDREYDQTDEILVDEETGELNVDAINKRAGELEDLIRIREAILKKVEKMKRIAERVMRTYRTIITRLTRSLRHAKKKDRKGIRAQIGAFRDKRREWRGVAADLRLDVTDAKLDIGDITSERAEVLGTQADPPDVEEPPAEEATDPEQRPPTPEEIAKAALEQLGEFDRGRQELFRNFGSNFTLAGQAPVPQTDLGRAAGTMHFGAATSGAAGAFSDPQGGPAGGDRPGVTINQTNNFPTPPPEPHTWARQTLFETQAAG